MTRCNSYAAFAIQLEKNSHTRVVCSRHGLLYAQIDPLDRTLPEKPTATTRCLVAKYIAHRQRYPHLCERNVLDSEIGSLAMSLETATSPLTETISLCASCEDL